MVRYAREAPVVVVDRDGVQQRVRARALAEGAPVSVRHVAEVCRELLVAVGVGVRLRGQAGVGEPVHATGDVVARLLELEITLGEGPGVLAMAQGHPVLAAGLDDPRVARRWPAFAAAVTAEGLRAVFAFPLAVGAVGLGGLEIYRAAGEPLTGVELEVALLLARMMTGQVLDQADRVGPTGAGSAIGERWHEDWRGVHQATGMVAVQLGCTVSDAVLRLRAHAYGTGRRLSEVADDIVAGLLRLAPGSPHDDPMSAVHHRGEGE